MLRSNCDAYCGALLASGVAFGYTAPLRCPLTIHNLKPMKSPSLAAFGRGSSGVRGVSPPRAVGRTSLGTLAQRLDYRNRSEPRFLRAYQGASGSSGSPRAANRVL